MHVHKIKAWCVRQNQSVNLNVVCKLGHAMGMINAETTAKIGTIEKGIVIFIGHYIYPKNALVPTTVEHFDLCILRP